MIAIWTLGLEREKVLLIESSLLSTIKVLCIRAESMDLVERGQKAIGLPGMSIVVMRIKMSPQKVAKPLN